MNTEQKFRTLWQFLCHHGPLEMELKLAPESGHLDYDIHRLWVDSDEHDRLRYRTDRFSACHLDRQSTNYELDIDYLYEQIYPIMGIDNNLF